MLVYFHMQVRDTSSKQFKAKADVLVQERSKSAVRTESSSVCWFCPSLLVFLSTGFPFAWEAPHLAPITLAALVKKGGPSLPTFPTKFLDLLVVHDVALVKFSPSALEKTWLKEK